MLDFRISTTGTALVVECTLFGCQLGELVPGADTSATQGEGVGRQSGASKACKNYVGEDGGDVRPLLRCCMGTVRFIGGEANLQ